MTDIPDETLVRAIAAGDHAALEALAERYEPSLLGLANGLVGPASAPDCVQETWIRVLRHARTFKGKSSAKSWLYRIATNRCLTERKKTLRKHRARDNTSPPKTDDRLADLRLALDTLDEKARAIVLLCYHQGLTHDEAADALQIPRGTLKSRLHAALKRLRNAMEDPS